MLIEKNVYLAKGNPEKKLKWAFKMYDIDSNGSVDRQEMLKIIEVRLKFLNKILQNIHFLYSQSMS